MDCKEIERLMELRLDGQLDSAEHADFEDHLRQCASCRRKVEAQAWLQCQIRAKLREGSTQRVPCSLRARIRTTARRHERSQYKWTRSVPVTLGLAAVVLLSWRPQSSTEIDVAVTRHTENLPPEVWAPMGNEEPVKAFLRHNLRRDFSIPKAQKSPTRLLGARLVHVQNDKAAAHLTYMHRGNRISILAYPSDNLNLAPDFEWRQVNGHNFAFGRRRGYKLVTWSDDALVYSMVSNLDERELVKLVNSF